MRSYEFLSVKRLASLRSEMSLDRRESTAKKQCWSQTALYSVAKIKDVSSNFFTSQGQSNNTDFSDVISLISWAFVAMNIEKIQANLKSNCFKMACPRESSFLSPNLQKFQPINKYLH